MQKRIIETLVSLLFLSNVVYGSQSASDDVEFYLNDDGLKVIVEQIDKQLLSGVDPRPLPDIEGEVNERVSFKFKGINYIVKLDRFDITPRSNFINLDIDVRKAFFSASSMDIEAKYFGSTFKYTCTGLSVDFDKKEAQNISGDVGASIEDGKVKLDIQNITYELRKKDIVVTGPETCVGSFGAKWLVKWLVRRTIKKFRNILEEEMVQVLKQLVPDIENILNAYTQNSFKVRFDGSDPLPSFGVTINMKPHDVTIDTDGVRFSMDTSFDASRRKPTVDKSVVEDGKGLRLGNIGFSPQIANEVLSEVFPDGTDYIEINKIVPAIDEYLTTSTASIVWPGIVDEDLTKTYLRVSLRARKAPRNFVDEDYKGLRVEADDIDVLFKVHKDGKWMDYFQMNTDIKAYAKATIRNGLLSFQVDEKSEVFVDGKFLGVFAERVDTNYDPEMAELILSGVLDFLHGSAPLLGISIPISNIAGVKVGAEDVFFDSEFARVGVAQTK